MIAASLDERKIEEIVDARARRGWARAGAGTRRAGASGRRAGARPTARGATSRAARNGVYADAGRGGAGGAARRSRPNEQTPVATAREDDRGDARGDARATIELLSRYAVEETGLGPLEDKLNKNRLVAEKTPGIEILRPVAYTGDDGLMLTERAPYGVILAITPTTNPTETILCNAIGMVAGGNAVVFNVHPSARADLQLVRPPAQRGDPGRGRAARRDRLDREADDRERQALMKHPRVRLVVVTGGPGGGQGGDELGQEGASAPARATRPRSSTRPRTSSKAADAIVRGASLDNNIVCIAEKEVIAVDSIADELIRQLAEAAGAAARRAPGPRAREGRARGRSRQQEVGRQGRRRDRRADRPGGHGHDLRLLLCEVDEQHPFVQHELLMPVIPLVRVARRGRGDRRRRCGSSTASTTPRPCTRRNIDNMAAMARVCNCSIFVKNDASYAGLGLGGEGYTSFTIASPTGEGLTTAVHFTRERRCTLKEAFRFV